MTRVASLVYSIFVVAAAATVACGVPISAGEITATAVSNGASAQFEVATQTSSRSANQLPADETARASGTLTPTPLATRPASTLTPTPASASTASSSSTSTPVASGTVTLPQSPSPTPTPVPAGNLAAEAARILNDYRTGSGRSALIVNQTLTAAANSYARFMAERNFFGHDGPDGSSPQSRIAAAGYAGRFRGEALAAGQTSAQSAIDTWLNSPAHAAILLDPSAVEVGIGYYFTSSSSFGHYWVLVTGIP